VNPIAEDYRQAIAKVQSLRDQPITLFDALVAALAHRLGLEVWTYDHHFDVMALLSGADLFVLQFLSDKLQACQSKTPHGGFPHEWTTMSAIGRGILPQYSTF